MERRASAAFGRIAGLFTLSFVAALVVIALLGTFGLPAAIVGALLGGATLVTFAAVGIGAGTIEPSAFYLADRALPPAINGVAGATAVLSGTIFLGLAGAYFSEADSAAAFAAGLALGFLVLAVAVAPYFRKSGAFGVADFLGIRFGGRTVRVAAATVVVLALLPALAAAIATAAGLAAPLLGVSAGIALVIVVAVVLAATAIGGVRGVTLTAIVEYVVLALAFLTPVVIASMREFSVPLPQLTFGYALQAAASLVATNGHDLAANLPRELLTLPAAGGGAMVLSVAAGVAVLPHLLLRTATVGDADHARRSAGWALFFVLAIVLAAPAYVGFVKLTLLRDVVGTSISALPNWLFTFGADGLVEVCGADATSAVSAMSACGSDSLAANDLALSGDAIVLAAPAMLGLPTAFSALIALGALAAALAAASAMAIAIANAVGHDLYGAAFDPYASSGRRLLVTRVALVVVVGVATWFGARVEGAALTLVNAAISLSAGGLFPAVILAIWWPRANVVGALAGIATGGAVTLVITLGYLFPDPVIPGPLDWLHLDDLTGALAGIAVGFVAAVVGSLVTPAPNAERKAIAAAIRLPSGTAFVHESET